ncbi:chemotaxis protein CheB [Propionivibrio dicarboxylicus]|uniref:protein-glutamate O-methyltransferase n=1 Tax=Propionivibrio dicarboxylicus TaxID=83767 RepID=A0A1G7Z9L4_9RHOO|nr:chemotaxis protein CheB [Propionivibrio dicarboxylicus]SDH05226.1 two-component system, chemotaxis family, CheB/CheR fusion protein [Propionivibrio dicarboxylicus]
MTPKKNIMPVTKDIQLAAPSLLEPSTVEIADSAPAAMIPTDFPVIGIGCSAGGLNALEKFFRHVPAGIGATFVVIQHLAPDHASVLPELLQRVTSMVVAEATDGLVLQTGFVYIIPPNRDISLLHGTLRLFEFSKPDGQHLPIDFFFRSLAEDRRSKAIGVVLSGMGSDGLCGVRAIKDKGGLTLAQEPTSALADSMPRSVIEAGLADSVAIPEALAKMIADHLGYPALSAHSEAPTPTDVHRALDKIIILLRDRGGNDFSQYKNNTLHRRIERRMAVHQIAAIDDYVRYLRDNPDELDLLFKELLIGVTSFFRDADVWEHLRTKALPALLARHPRGRALRAWVPACSTGEEAYTLAMVFKDVLAQQKPEARFTLQIYATDLDTDAIDTARKGLYPANISKDVSPERLAQYFTPEERNGYRISKKIRDMLVFAVQNVISDPPFTKLDILTCRNLLIYFDGKMQKKLLPLFYYALNPDALLVLGNAESVGNFNNLFSPINQKARIFRRCDQVQSISELEFPRKMPSTPLFIAPPSHSLPGENLAQLTDQFIQQTFAPAAVLVNAEGDILYVSGRTGKYLEPAAGKFNINIHAMAREGLREALTGVISRALKDSVPILMNGLHIGTNGGTQVVNVVVQAIEKPDALRGRVIIVFKDVPTPRSQRRTSRKGSQSDQSALMQELQQTREALQVTREEMQTTVEELKSSNEELQSTNEELQSTNEELTSSKEELQSLNEELQTVNAELQSKVDDLTWVRNDMTNLLNSTEIATIFLDNELMLRRFTTYATKLFKLIPGDVGRPLSDVVTDLEYPQLKNDALEVLRSLVFQEKEIPTRDGRWYRVRVMPYRTQDNVIDGVVMTFIEITKMKQLEADLKRLGA